MGSEPGWVTPRHGRALIGGAVLASTLVVSGAAAAAADDPAPTPVPTAGSTVSPPSQQQIEDARTALDRLKHGSRTATPATLTEVSGPTGGSRPGSVASRISDEAWWTGGAGLLVLLVASEATRLSARRAKHRGSA
jgi:hypothetical protein